MQQAAEKSAACIVIRGSAARIPDPGVSSANRPEETETVKKVWKYLSSMQFAVILLLFLIAACAAGSFVTQGREAAWYTAAYGQRRGGLILSLHLDDVFHSLWFIALSAVLCLNLLLCSIVRLPSLLRLTKAWGSGGQALREAAPFSQVPA